MVNQLPFPEKGRKAPGGSRVPEQQTQEETAAAVLESGFSLGWVSFQVLCMATGRSGSWQDQRGRPAGDRRALAMSEGSRRLSSALLLPRRMERLGVTPLIFPGKREVQMFQGKFTDFLTGKRK